MPTTSLIKLQNLRIRLHIEILKDRLFIAYRQTEPLSVGTFRS